MSCDTCKDELFWMYSDEVADQFAKKLVDLHKRLEIATSQDDWMEEECTSYCIDEIRTLRDAVDAIATKAEGSAGIPGEAAEETGEQLSFVFKEDS